MTPKLDAFPILDSLIHESARLIDSARTENVHDFYAALSNIERMAAYHKTKLHSRTVIDPTTVEDEDL